MGRYFGRQPRYSQQEAEAQAKEAIDAAVKKGRPPAEEWKGLANRMGDINRELATRPPVDIPSPPPLRRPADPDQANAGRPRAISDILRPRTPAAEPAAPEAAAPPPAAPAPAKRVAKATGARKAPAKRVTKVSEAAAPSPKKRAARPAEPPAPAPTKRPAAKKRPAGPR